MGVERRCECSELARTAYGACASDGRSADAWTERAPILRGREGVNPFPAKVLYTRPGARLSRDRLPSASPIKATTPF